MALPVRLSPWSGGGFAFLDEGASSTEPVRFWPWRLDRRGLPDGYSGTSLATGLGLARVFEAAALSLPALVAALAVLAGFAGLEGFDLAAVGLVDFEIDDARLGGMALKSNLLCGHPASRTIKLVRNFE